MGISIVPSVLHPAQFILDLGPRKKEAALQFMLTRAHASGGVRQIDPVHDALLMRERLGSTAIGKGVAVPHGRALAVVEPRLIVARSTRGIEWGAADALPVQLVLLALSPAETSLAAHMDWLARVIAAVRPARTRTRLIEAEGVEEMAAAIRIGPA